MLESTFYSDGNNNFENNTFLAREWSAPSMVSPAEIKDYLKLFRLEGRTIKKMKMIGLAYNLDRDSIEEHAYVYYDKLGDEDAEYKCNYSTIDPSLPYSRFAEIDEPLLIEFEDGDVFEICTPEVPEFRMSMNCIPWYIKAGTNLPNADANILFSPCIGQTITDIEIETYETDSDPIFSKPFEDGQIRECVSAFILRLSDGIRLRIEGWMDFCHVSITDANGNKGIIAFEELKLALFNYEDLNIDNFSGYKATSRSFMFGKLGAEHTDSPYITLIPGDKDTSLNINIDDFILFEWSITHFKLSPFDEYGDYEFTKEQWDKILAEAERLVSFDNFDDLFDYVASINIEGYQIIGGGRYSVTLNNINCCGVDFWKNMDKYRTQLKDMKVWSGLVLSDSDKMAVHGY